MEFLSLTDDLVETHRAEIIRVYVEAFETNVDHGKRFFDNSLGRHRGYHGFSGLLAVEGDQVAGFTYGYHSQPGRWWYDTVGPSLHEAGHGAWLEDAFEFVELAVDPSFHGQGIGGRLHDGLLASRSEATALLSTGVDESPARTMYCRRGWVSLVEPFHYGPEGEAVVLMGLDLAGWQARRTGIR